MIPLTESLKMAFNAVLRLRQNRPDLKSFDLNPCEIAYIKRFLKDNCHFTVSQEEIKLLFWSYQYKRTHKKKKTHQAQLSLYV